MVHIGHALDRNLVIIEKIVMLDTKSFKHSPWPEFQRIHVPAHSIWPSLLCTNSIKAKPLWTLL